jgi:hypothetical protein
VSEFQRAAGVVATYGGDGGGQDYERNFLTKHTRPDPQVFNHLLFV